MSVFSEPSTRFPPLPSTQSQTVRVQSKRTLLGGGGLGTLGGLRLLRLLGLALAGQRLEISAAVETVALALGLALARLLIRALRGLVVCGQLDQNRETDLGRE